MRSSYYSLLVEVVTVLPRFKEEGAYPPFHPPFHERHVKEFAATTEVKGQGVENTPGRGNMWEISVMGVRSASSIH